MLKVLKARQGMAGKTVELLFSPANMRLCEGGARPAKAAVASERR